MNMRTGEVQWRFRTPTPINTAALTTAGDVVIAGDWDRHLYVFNAADGKVLWQTRLPTSLQGFPITYESGGQQFLAVPTGSGGGSWGTMLPAELTSERRKPQGGNAVYVFGLP